MLKTEKMNNYLSNSGSSLLSLFKVWHSFSIVVLLTFTFVFILSTNVGARMERQKNRPTDEELKALPRWLQTQVLASPRLFHGDMSVPDSLMKERAMWAREMGIERIMIYTHHYAFGVNWVNRYKRSFDIPYKGVEQDRALALQKALGQFLFMRNYIKPEHSIYTDYHMRIAYVYEKQGDFRKADERYKLLLRFKPKFVPGYIEYARFANSLGMKNAALEILKSGLEKTGDELIRQAISEMGGSEK